MEIRKLKEMEYEILTSSIRGWEGEVSCDVEVNKDCPPVVVSFACTLWMLYAASYVCVCIYIVS